MTRRPVGQAQMPAGPDTASSMDNPTLLEALLERSSQDNLFSLLLTHPRDLAWRDIVTDWRDQAAQKVSCGETEEALRIAQVIYDLGRALEDEAIIAQSHWTWGNIYALASRARDALSHFEKAAATFTAQGETLNLARLTIGWVWALHLVGQYQLALTKAQESWKTLEASPEAGDRRRLAGLANNMGILYKRLGRYDEAIALYEKKLALWQDRPDDPGAVVEMARAHINLGALKKQLNLWPEALAHLEEGRARLQSAATSHRVEIARAEMHLAELSILRQAPRDKVQRAFARARHSAADFPGLLSLEISECAWLLEHEPAAAEIGPKIAALRQAAAERGALRGLVQVELLAAAHAARQGALGTAIAGYEAVERAAESIDDWELMRQAWQGLGLVWLQLGNYTAAQAALQKAVEAIERVRGELGSKELRNGFLDSQMAPFHDLIRLNLGRGHFEEAFYWSERARGRELVERLHGQRLRHANPRPTPEPVYAVAYADACQMLPDDTLMLHYTVVRDQVWCFPMTRRGPTTPVGLGPASSPQAVEEGLDWVCNVRALPACLIEAHASSLTAAARLPLARWYDRFLAPLEGWLEKYPRLILTLDGVLLHLPFHAFYNQRRHAYVLETHDVSYTPSATAWYTHKLTRPPAMTTSAATGMILAYAGRTLPYVAAEVEAIRQAYPNFTVFLGEQARPERLADALTQTCAYIHLTAHAVFRPDNPLYSYIELAHGRLETKDVLGLQLSARLVALSACETGRGLPRGGEHVGLARAFLLAGAGATLVSHWGVDDRAAVEMIGRFYREMAGGQSLSAALCAAQRAFVHHTNPAYQHPFYWAAFFLFGAA